MARSVMLSVIVPVYDVDRKYLSECFESILNQTFTDFELIIVEDGTKDDLAAYIDTYDYRIAKVSIIRQENRGVACARNAGLDVCAGKYITFVDSDDTLEPDCFAGIVDFAQTNSTDVLMFGINKVYPARKEVFSPYTCDIGHFTKEQKEEVQFKCMVGILPFYVCPPASSDAAGSACAKLYRNDFLQKEDLKYTPGLKRAEDMEFNLRVFDRAQAIGYLYRFYYNYRQIDTSATFVYRSGGIEVFTDALRAIRKHLVSSGKSDLYMQVYYMRCMFFFLESMDMDYLNKQNPKPLGVRIRELAAQSQNDPYYEAFRKLSSRNLTFARKIPLFLIRHKMFYILAVFYSVYRKVSGI